MFAIAIDRGDQRPQGHVALAGDFLQAVPELVFNADAGLVACNDNRALRNLRPHGFSPAQTKSKEVPCLTVARINSTCCRNNTVNGEHLEYLRPVSVGVSGEMTAGARTESPWGSRPFPTLQGLSNLSKNPLRAPRKILLAKS